MTTRVTNSLPLVNFGILAPAAAPANAAAPPPAPEQKKRSNAVDAFDASAFSSAPAALDAAADLFPGLDALDPLTYKVAGNYKLPGDSPAELQAVKDAVASRTPTQNAAAIELNKTGSNSLWLHYADDFANKAGPIKGFLVKALLEVVLGTDGVAVALQKFAAHEPRPYMKDPSIPLITPPAKGDSYPSGHAASAYAAATVLSHFMPERKDELFSAAANVGRSRVYLGVHYPGDVAYGARFGSAWAHALLLEKGVKA